MIRYRFIRTWRIFKTSRKEFLDLKRSPSTMLPPTQRVKAAALACLALLVITADFTDAKVLIFKFQDNIRYHIRNYGLTVETFKITGNFFLQFGNDIKKPFIAQLNDVEIVRSDRFGKNQTLNNCTSFDKTLNSLMKPFSALYNDYFILKGLKFSKDDTHFSKNFKFSFMANKVQIHVPTLARHKESEFTDYANETTLMGNCKLMYNVKRTKESGDVSFDEIKKTPTEGCGATRSQNNEYTLGGNCNTGKRKNFRSRVSADQCVKLNKNKGTFINSALNEQRSFQPWQNNQKVFVAQYNARMDYQVTLETNLLPLSIDTTDEIVSGPLLSKPNREVLKIQNSKLANLLEADRALGCDASETGSRELVEEVLKCYLPE